MNPVYDPISEQLRMAAMKNQVGEEFAELKGDAGAGAFSFAQEAHHLRVVAALVAQRLSMLGIVLDGSRTQTWNDGTTRYRVTTSAKTTMEVEEDVLRIRDKELWESLQQTVLNKTALRKMIEQGQVEDWQRYAFFHRGKPFVSVKEEKVVADSQTVVMDEEVQA